MCRKRRFNCLTGLSAGDVALWAVSNHLLWVDEGEGEGAASLFVEIRNEIRLRHLRRKRSLVKFSYVRPEPVLANTR